MDKTIYKVKVTTRFEKMMVQSLYDSTEEALQETAKRLKEDFFSDEGEVRSILIEPSDMPVVGKCALHGELLEPEVYVDEKGSTRCVECGASLNDKAKDVLQ